MWPRDGPSEVFVSGRKTMKDVGVKEMHKSQVTPSDRAQNYEPFMALPSKARRLLE